MGVRLASRSARRTERELVGGNPDGHSPLSGQKEIIGKPVINERVMNHRQLELIWLQSRNQRRIELNRIDLAGISFIKGLGCLGEVDALPLNTSHQQWAPKTQ